MSTIIYTTNEEITILKSSVVPPDQYNAIVALIEGLSPDPIVTPPPVEEDITFYWPTHKKVLTQAFGINPQWYKQFGLPGHEGLDMKADMNSLIRAVWEGKVVRVDTLDTGQHPNYGWSIRVETVLPYKGEQRTYEMTYAHLVEPSNLKLGDMVKMSDILGKADSTGNSTGSHLHLMLKRREATARGETNFPHDIIDPTPFFAELR